MKFQLLCGNLIFKTTPESPVGTELTNHYQINVSPSFQFVDLSLFKEFIWTGNKGMLRCSYYFDLMYVFPLLRIVIGVFLTEFSDYYIRRV